MNYLDFELEISPGDGHEYPVAVTRSPGGEARGVLHMPFRGLALENQLLILEKALLRSGGRRRTVLSKEQRAVQDFGQALFAALFAGDIRSRYDVSLTKAHAQNHGLRVKLRILDPRLAALPWEFLYDADQGEYVCLTGETPIVRYLELPRPPRPLPVQLPLRVLGMVANPQDLQPLDAARERQRMARALQPLQAAGLVELTWLEGQTWRDLQRAMRRGPWHIFHFTGHGRFDPQADEGQIALADDEGYARYLSATGLGRLLSGHRSLRLALLNACEGAHSGGQDIFSSAASILVRRGLPAVVAMQYEITDAAAIEFARAFYEALADGYPIDAAVTEARKAISLAVNNTVEWGTPVLFMRAPSGALFEVTGPAQPSAQPPTQPAPRARKPQPAPRRAVPELALELTAHPNPADVGAAVTWTLTVRNAGPAAAANITLLHGHTLLADEPLALQPGETQTLTFPADYASVGEQTETVRVMGGVPYQEVAGAVTVFTPPSLALTLAPKPQTVKPGVRVTWAVTVQNDGGAALEQVILNRGRKLLAEPFALAVGETRTFSFPATYKTGGKKTIELVAAGTTPAGRSVRDTARGTVQVQPPTPQTLKITTPFTMELAHIPGGSFLMGSPDGEVNRDKDETQHPVIVGDFYMAKHAVTVAQFETFITESKHKMDNGWRNDVNGKKQTDKNHPVIRVNWHDADAYCQWLSNKKLEGTFRLPTEAEWEYACRAGTTTPFNTGENLTTAQANYDGNYPYNNHPKGKYLKKTTPVGSYPPNAWGLYDMHGNVYEWCLDWYGADYYNECKAEGTVENPAGPADGSRRVLRGGYWYGFARRCRSAYRNRFTPGYRNDSIGFRLVFVPQVQA